MGFPQAKLAKLNGIVQYGYVGIYRMIKDDSKKSFMYAPAVRPDKSHVRPDCGKVLLCEDQIFSIGIKHRDVSECFKYGFSYPDNPDENVHSGIFSGENGAIIAVQLPRPVGFNAIYSSVYGTKAPVSKSAANGDKSVCGQIQICLGTEVSDRSVRIHNLMADTHTRKCQPIAVGINPSARQGNIIWIEVGPHTEVPYMTFGVSSSYQVNAMFDRITDTPRKRRLGNMMASENGTIDEAKATPWYTQNQFDTTIHKCSIDKFLFKEGLRFSPAFGHPDWIKGFYLDFQLLRSKESDTMSILKLSDYPPSFYGKPDYIINIAKEFVYRYGLNKDVDTEKRPVDTKTEYPRPNQKPHINKIKVGTGMARGIHIDNIFSQDPFEFAKAQARLYKEIKKIDETFWVGMSIGIDRNFMYFATQYMRKTIKKQCFDYLNLKVCSYDDLWEIYSIFGMCHTYLEGISVFIELDFEFDWREYPAILYICSQWNVARVIFNGYEDFIKKYGLGGEFLKFIDWFDVSRDFMTTKIHLFEDSIHAMGIDEKTGDKTHVLCRAIGAGKKVIRYKGEDLDMPIICEGKYKGKVDG